MLFSHTHPKLPSLWVVVSTVSAAVLQPLQAINNQLLFPYGSTNGTGIIALSNATTLSPNPSADLNAIRAQCNGQMFGSGLNVASCRNAFNKIKPFDDYSSFGTRHDGQTYDGVLPFRWLSEDGKCSFELFLIAPATVAHATTRDIKSAAQALLDKCTASSPAKGGVASSIGGDNRLAVAMKLNDYSNVVCQPAPGPPLTAASIRVWHRRCQVIVHDIDATIATQIFGPHSAPGVAVGLPTGFHDPEDRCIVQIVNNGLTDSTSWYRIWEDVDAIVSMCVAAGYIGKSSGIGSHGNIGVEMHWHI